MIKRIEMTRILGGTAAEVVCIGGLLLAGDTLLGREMLGSVLRGLYLDGDIKTDSVCFFLNPLLFSVLSALDQLLIGTSVLVQTEHTTSRQTSTNLL